MVVEPLVDASQIHRGWWHRGPFARREVRLSVGTVLIFLFIFYVALPLLASHRAEVNSLAHIHFGYLAIGLLLEVAALAAYTQLTYTVLPSGGPKRFRLFRINMSTLALSHVSPGGTAPGAALGYRLLTQSGVTGSDTGFALGTQGIGSAVVLNVMFWLSLVAFLVTHGFHVPASHHGGQSQSASILVFVAAGVGVILLGAFGSLFYLLTRGQQRASRVIRRVAGRIRFLDADRTTRLVERLAARFAVMTENRSLTRKAVGWAAANWLLDAASLWVFLAAFGHFISPIDLLVAYGLANILAAVPVTPAGLGVVEFVLVSMVTGFGPTAGAALSGVLAYRAVNFWLPIPFGGLAYASLEFERRPIYQRFQRFVHRRIASPRATGSGTPVTTPGVAVPGAGGPVGVTPGRALLGVEMMDLGSPAAGPVRAKGAVDAGARRPAGVIAGVTAGVTARARAGVIAPVGAPVATTEPGRWPAEPSMVPSSTGPPAVSRHGLGRARAGGQRVRSGSRRGGGAGIREPALRGDPAG